MRYWWVKQNQTISRVIERGSLWSPKRGKNGHRMRRLPREAGYGR